MAEYVDAENGLPKERKLAVDMCGENPHLHYFFNQWKVGLEAAIL